MVPEGIKEGDFRFGVSSYFISRQRGCVNKFLGIGLGAGIR